MFNTILNIAIGFFLALIGMFMTSLAVGERASLNRESENYQAMGKVLRFVVLLLFVLALTVISLSYLVSFWFLLVFIPSIILGLSIKAGTGQSVGKGQKQEKEKLFYSDRTKRIINDYGATLVNASKQVFDLPESSLPYSKDEIKNAIKSALLNTKDKAIQENLKIGYMELARFVPDQNVKISKAYQDAIQSGDLNHPGWADADQAIIIWERINAESQALLAEVDEYINPKNHKKKN